MVNFNLQDIWRIRNPEAKRFTRRQNTKAGVVHSRIDYFLASINLNYEIEDTNIATTGLISDYSIIEISI